MLPSAKQQNHRKFLCFEVTQQIFAMSNRLIKFEATEKFFFLILFLRNFQASICRANEFFFG